MLLVAAWAEMYGALSLETPAFVGVSVGWLYLAINLRRRDVPLSPCLRVQLQCSARVPKLGGGYRHRRDEPQLQLEGWDGSGVSAAAACLTLLKMVPSTIMSIITPIGKHSYRRIRRQLGNIFRKGKKLTKTNKNLYCLHCYV